jgi:hypothetical protein
MHGTADFFSFELGHAVARDVLNHQPRTTKRATLSGARLGLQLPTGACRAISSSQFSLYFGFHAN